MTHSERIRQRSVPYVLLAPFLFTVVVFTVYPVCLAAVLSLEQTFGPRTAKYVGLSNYAWILSDPLFWTAVANSLIFACGSLVTQLPTSLGLAMILNDKHIRGRTLFRLIFFFPSLIGLVFVALIFGPLLEKNTGLLNVALHHWIGFSLEFPWLENYVMLALILAAFWMYMGVNMVYFLAALQSVDATLLEAATIDGAGPWARFRHVTLPAIQPVAMFIALLSLVGSAQLFELPYILLNYGSGPENRGLTVLMYLYQRGFELGDLGYASAIGWVLVTILASLAVWQHRFLIRNER